MNAYWWNKGHRQGWWCCANRSTLWNMRQRQQERKQALVSLGWCIIIAPTLLVVLMILDLLLQWGISLINNL